MKIFGFQLKLRLRI